MSDPSKDLEQKVIDLSLKEDQKSTDNDSRKKDSSSFMLTEYKQIASFWLQADSRLVSTLRLYFTATTIFVSVCVFFSKEFELNIDIWSIAIFIAGVLFLGGILLYGRIVKTIMIKSEYRCSLNLIRKYFVDQYPEVAPYTLLPVNNKIKGKEEFKSKVKSRVITAIQIWCAFLLALIIYSLLILGSFIHPLWIIVPILLSLILFILLDKYYKRKYDKFASKYLK